jgi:phosphopantetheine adenylyltransferase
MSTVREINAARIDGGVLHLISPSFDRLDIPITKIPEFSKVDSSRIQEFEIDEDGAFIYWPEFDLHLGWAQLQQLVDPVAALKASQESQEFNKRYGRAVQKVRVQTGLKPIEISGISDKQLQRIENGECRLTTNAIEVLSKAHKLAPNDYMTKLAGALD